MEDEFRGAFPDEDRAIFGVELAMPQIVPSILVVEDDPDQLALETALIFELNFSCDRAVTVAEARKRLEERPYDIVILDLQLPDGSGMEILEEKPNFTKNTVVAVVSAEQELGTAVRVMREGAYDFISKPYAVGTFSERLLKVVDEWRSRSRFEYYQENLERLVDTMTGRLMSSSAEMEQVYDMTIRALGAAIDLRDPETEDHCARVAEQSVILGRALGMTDKELLNLRRGAYLHDVGKIGVPEGILGKPGPLTEEEYEIVRLHPLLGFRLISHITFLRGSSDVILYHHERFDGRGYPHGLRGKQIPLAARVFSVIDTMDAMLHDRSYRDALSYAELIEELTRNAGTQFDPEIVAKFSEIPHEEWEKIDQAHAAKYSRKAAAKQEVR